MAAVAKNGKKPSPGASVTEGSELEKLQALSQVVHDTKGAADADKSIGELGVKAATVSASVLLAVLGQNTGDVGALEGAMARGTNEEGERHCFFSDPSDEDAP